MYGATSSPPLASLSATFSLIKLWVPLPPTQSQIDSALINISTIESHVTLTLAEIKAFAVKVFKESMVSNARKAILRRAPIGIAGIVGIGMATWCGGQLVGKLMGVYVLGIVIVAYAVNLINNPSEDFSMFSMLVHDIQTCFASFRSTHYRHIYREANSMAHALAKFGSSNGVSHLWLEHFVLSDLVV